MESKTFALVEMLAFTGLALAIGVWQLISINRTLKQTRAEEAERAAREQGDGES
jgi:hypothetical protein